MMDRDERLKQLAEMAPSERDLQKFMAFVREINLTLEEKQEHLNLLPGPGSFSMRDNVVVSDVV